MNKQKALLGLFGILTIMASLFLQAMPAHQAYADPITSRSLTLEAGTDPGSKPGGVVNHQFIFTLPNTGGGNVGSIEFQYCMTAADVGAQTCVVPTGLVTTGAGMTFDTTGSAATFSSLVNTVGQGETNGTFYVSRSPAALTASSVIKIKFLGITNPTTANQTFFVRISSYASSDTTGSPIDTGTVAAATANQLTLSGNMPESLVFCTGDNIGETNGVPDCTTATNNTVNFNQLFSPTSTAFATSQMVASTNAGSGYAITANGTTLESGGNQINPIDQASEASYDPTNPAPYSEKSKFGISQFGLNVVQNTGTEYTNAPNISGNSPEPDSANINPASGTGNYHGEPAPSSGYDTAGYFKYNAGDVVADSNSTYSDAQIYTVSYIVNVPGSQAAGTYQTTMTYICTPTF